MRFGILQRYVAGEVFRAFLLALLTVTSVVVLIMVMAEAMRSGLAPMDILRLIPFIVPTSLPYTMPVALLFAVTVVYGRLAGDNEIIAVKSAGQSAMIVLMPSFFFGLGLSGLLAAASSEGIPRATHMFRKIIFNNVEDYVYRILKKERQFDNPSWPFYIKVKDVEGRKMIHPIFKHRCGGPANPNNFDVTVVARAATLKFDLDHGVVRVYLEDAESTGSSAKPDSFFFQNDMLEIQLPDANRLNQDAKIQELTNGQMKVEQKDLKVKLAKERKRQAIAAAMWIASGRITRVGWPHFQGAFKDYLRWERKYNELETEMQMRNALAWGGLFFVLVGAPVGILFARRDFLSAFISCFLPIIVVYYPLTLLGVNLGKEGMISPQFSLWGGNAVLALLAGLVLRPVMKH